MRRMLTVLAVLTAVMFACGEDPTGILLQPDAWDLAIVGGQDQSDTIEAELPDPIAARLTQDSTGSLALDVGIGPRALLADQTVEGVAVAGQLICWDVPKDEWGRVVPSCDETDSTGVAVGRWILGSRARQVHAVGYTEYEGEVVAVDTVWSTIEPGKATTIGLPSRVGVWLGDTLRLPSLLAGVSDRYGNSIPADLVAWSGPGDSTGTYVPAVEAWDTATASLDGRESSTEVVALARIDSGWTYALKCVDGATPFTGDRMMDSVVIRATVTGRQQVEIDDAIEGWALEADLLMGAFVGRWFATGDSIVYDGLESRYDLHQRPGGIELAAEIQGAGWQYIAMAADSTAPTTYTATGNRCGGATTVVDELRAPAN